jgi:hypothetical protein
MKRDNTISCGPLAKPVCDVITQIRGKFSNQKVFLDIPYSYYEDCEDVLRKLLNNVGLEPVVAKDRLTSSAVLCKICELIRTCKYGISDISFERNSVIYEYGLMHGFGLKVCLLLRREREKFTDIHGLDHIPYDGLREFKIGVCKWLLENVPEIQEQKARDILHAEKHSLKKGKEIPLKNPPPLNESDSVEGEDMKDTILSNCSTRIAEIKKEYSKAPCRAMYVVPSQVKEPLTDLNTLLTHKEKFVLTLPQNGAPFPCRAHDLKTTKNSLIFIMDDHEVRPYLVYYELNIFGLVAFQELLYEYEESSKKTGLDLFLTERRLFIFLRLVRNFFTTINYSGSIEIHFQLENVRGLRLVGRDPSDFERIEGEIKYDDTIIFKENIPIADLERKSDELAMKIYETVTAAAGLDPQAYKTIERAYLAKAKKEVPSITNAGPLLST